MQAPRQKEHMFCIAQNLRKVASKLTPTKMYFLHKDRTYSNKVNLLIVPLSIVQTDSNYHIQSLTSIGLFKHMRL